MKQYRFRINGNYYRVEVDSVTGNKAEVKVNGTDYQVEMDNSADTSDQLPPEPIIRKVSSAPKPSESARSVTAPLPGVIIALKVNKGDHVKAGQVVAILEAMKMENEIQTESDGIVTSVHVAEGDSISEGESIVTIEQ